MSNLFYVHTNGIGFRKIAQDDLAPLLAMLNDTWRGRHSWPFSNEYDQLEWFKRVTGDRRQMFMIAHDTHRVSPEAPHGAEVGLYKILNIDWLNRCADIGRDVYPIYQGRGYGVSILDAGTDFAFEMLGLHRLDTEIHADNAGALHIAYKCGWVHEGIRRSALFQLEHYIDSHMFGMLISDWRRLERAVGMAKTGSCPA